MFSIGLMALVVSKVQSQISETEMLGILSTYDTDASKLCNENAKANWAVQTDVMNTSLVAIQVSE